MNLIFTVSKPQFGWLPCQLTYGDFCIAFESSDVPNNPIEELMESLTKIKHGSQSEVWWHLEPAGYYFEFIVVHKRVNLKIYFSKNSSLQDKEEIFSLNSDLKSLYLVFYRALCVFKTFAMDENDWTQKIDFQSLDLIKEQLKDNPMKG